MFIAIATGIACSPLSSPRLSLPCDSATEISTVLEDCLPAADGFLFQIALLCEKLCNTYYIVILIFVLNCLQVVAYFELVKTFH